MKTCKKCVHYIPGKRRCKAFKISVSSTLNATKCVNYKEKYQINKPINKQNEVLRQTTLANLSYVLNSNLTVDMIRKAKDYKNFGNAKYAIKCIDEEQLIIRVKSNIGSMKHTNFKIIK